MAQNTQNKKGSGDALLALASGEVLLGNAFGAKTNAIGELCFNTSMSGYQEVLTDPSYRGQIIVFTASHIGNVGVNEEDMESHKGQAKGLVVREPITLASNHRSSAEFESWLIKNGVVGIAGVDTRALTLRLREKGVTAAAITPIRSHLNLTRAAKEAVAMARSCPPMKNREMAYLAGRKKTAPWKEGLWRAAEPWGKEKPSEENEGLQFAVVDYGAKNNILRHLRRPNCEVTVFPPTTSADEVLAGGADGVLLSNGPGDPQATAAKAAPTIRRLVDSGLPIFGICLGHQLLALALGAKTEKMGHGHRGANHPVLELETKRVEVTSQNHGFVVETDSLPAGVKVTHKSLFDGSLEGIRLEGRPVFSVQYHPEASPGPHDSHYLFRQFYRWARHHRKAKSGL